MMQMMFFAVLLLGGSGQTGDLLDLAPTNSYWEMRDQRVVDMETMSAVLVDGDATAADRLMAIRALGEISTGEDADPADSARALKTLKPFVGSEEPFVDRYAKRSIAWIEGRDPEPYPSLPDAVYDQDLALLPDHMSVVGQLKMRNNVGPVNLAQLIPDIKVDGESVRDQMMQEFLPGILQGVELIGNARIDLVTVGVRLTSEEEFYLAVIARGRYDRAAVQIALEEEIGDDVEASFYSVGDVEVVAVQNYDPVAFLMPSDELFILLFAEDRDAKLPVGLFAEKVQQADRRPSFNQTLSKQIEAIDRKQSDIWLAVEFTPLALQEPESREFFGAFDAARAYAEVDGEGVLDVKWVGEGRAAGQLKKQVAFFEEQVKEVIEDITRDKQRMPAPMQGMMDPVIEMMKSMTFKADGKTMTGGMKIDSSIGVTMPLMMGVSMDHRHEAEFHAVEEAVEEVAE
ncbi:MAG: hypothetical protein AAGB26_12720 [Planctomycetota bacterium]